MESNKFEESLKNTLEKRTVQPSSDAWERLEVRLEASKQKKVKSFFWLGMAASIVGVLLVVSQFLNNEKIQTITPVIVETPSVINNDKGMKVIAEESTDNDTLNNIKTNKVELKTYPQKAQQVVKASTKIQIGKIISNNVASVEDKSVNQEGIPAFPIKQEALSIEDQEINHVVAQVKILKENNSTITDEAIESLLQEALKDIRKQQLYNEKTGVVDARLLLENVEADLEKSFRDKVFEALKSNFNFVKTAVAQRND